MATEPQSNSNETVRLVHCEDAIQWLRSSEVIEGASLVASLPDISEFPRYSLEEWQSWFVDTAELILRRTPDDGVTIFYQSDIKLDSHWIDKGYLCQKAAERNGAFLLWHKIACRVPAGNNSYGRPGYSHCLCFSKSLQLDPRESTPDILPHLGAKAWTRGMGIEACAMICQFIATRTNTKTIVNPFCGHGSMLAMANAFKLDAIGIERSEKRAALAKKIIAVRDPEKTNSWAWNETSSAHR